MANTDRRLIRYKMTVKCIIQTEALLRVQEGSMVNY